MYTILEAASRRSRSKTSSLIGVVMAAGLLLKHRNQQMGLLQTIVSIILYTGHAAKKVSIIYTLNAHVMVHVEFYDTFLTFVLLFIRYTYGCTSWAFVCHTRQLLW